MKYVSSRNKNEIVESHNAIIQGLAKDGVFLHQKALTYISM